jgi:hypothetical protein
MSHNLRSNLHAAGLAAAAGGSQKIIRWVNLLQY